MSETMDAARADDLAATVRALRAQVQAQQELIKAGLETQAASSRLWRERLDAAEAKVEALTEERDRLKAIVYSVNTPERVKEATRAGLDRAIAVVEDFQQPGRDGTDEWVLQSDLLAALRAAREEVRYSHIVEVRRLTGKVSGPAREGDNHAI